MCAFVGGQGHGVREHLPRGKKPVVSAQAEVAGVDGHVCAQSPAMCMCVCVLPGMCPKRYLRPEGLMRSRSNRASFCERVGKQALIVAEILLQEQCFTMWNYDRGHLPPIQRSRRARRRALRPACPAHSTATQTSSDGTTAPRQAARECGQRPASRRHYGCPAQGASAWVGMGCHGWA